MNVDSNTNHMTDLRRVLFVSPASVPYIPVKTRVPTFNSRGAATYTPLKAKTKDCVSYFQEYMLIDEEVAAAAPGIYTWMLKDFGDHGEHLIATPTLSGQELGSLHLHMNHFTIPGLVIIAGELLISERADGVKQFKFNTLSGTYSLKLTEGERAMGLAHLDLFTKKLGMNTVFAPMEPILEAPGVRITLPPYMERNFSELCSREVFGSKSKRGGYRRTRRVRNNRRRRAATRGRSRRCH